MHTHTHTHTHTHMYTYTHREGDIYAALRDTEIALMLSPFHKKALQRRLWCLYNLSWYEEAKRFFQQYRESFPQDTEFTSKFHSELEKAVSEAGERFTSVS